jgi:hypothetical protein
MKTRTIILFACIIAGCQKEATQTQSVTANNVSNSVTHQTDSSDFNFVHLTCNGLFIHFYGTYFTHLMWTQSNGATVLNEKINIKATGYDDNGNEYKANTQTIFIRSFNAHHFSERNIINDRYTGKGGGGILKFTFHVVYSDDTTYTIKLGKITEECHN